MTDKGFVARDDAVRARPARRPSHFGLLIIEVAKWLSSKSHQSYAKAMLVLLLGLISLASRALERLLVGKVVRDRQPRREPERRGRRNKSDEEVLEMDSSSPVISDDEAADDSVIDDTIDDTLRTPTTSPVCKCKRRSNSVIDSIGSSDVTSMLPGHFTPRRTRSQPTEQISPDQGYPATPDPAESLRPEWMLRRADDVDAHMQSVANDEDFSTGETEISAQMPVAKDSNQYNMNHKNRGKCVIFNHEIFETGFDNREGSTVDAKRIERTFKTLGFLVETHHNLYHADLIGVINELSEEDHTDNDCICIFVLTHGLNNDMICAKDVAYKSDSIWKPFTADRCTTLAGKPKLFFFQACRGDKLDGGIKLRHNVMRTETDSAVASYKIPTHADFLIAHSSVQGFFSWRNPEEGTWYIQCLCDVFDEHYHRMDLVRMLTVTARKVATEYASYNDLNPMKHDQKQVPSMTSMLIRELYFSPK